MTQSVVDDVVNKSVSAKKCRKRCNSAEDRLRREKEKHPVSTRCSSVDEPKKGCVRKCQEISNPRALLESLKRTSEPLDLTHGRYSYSSSAEKENFGKEGEKSHPNFSFRNRRTWVK